LTTEHYRAEDASTLFRHDYTYDDDGNRYRKEYNGDSDLRVYYSDGTGSTSDGEDANLAPSNRVVRAWTRTGETGPTTTPNRYNVTGSYTEAHMDTIVVEPNDDAEKQVTATYHDDGFWIARNVELDDSDENTLEATITDLAGRSTTCPVEGTHPVKLDRNLDVSYEYDAAGNVTKKTQVERYDNKAPTSTTYVTRYWYDDANRLRYIDYDWTTTEDVHYVYGPTGERVEVRYGQIARDGDTFTSFTPAAGTARGFVCLGGVVLEEWTVSDGATGSHTDDSLDTLVHRYVRNPATDLGGGIASIIYQLDGSDYRYYHYNHKGDTAALTDEDGKIIAWYEYDAWGAPVTTWHASGVENDFRFSTKQWDATPSGPADAGLIYFGARYYDPDLARWTQLDPAGTVDGLNVYLYCRGDPVSRYDPHGLVFDVYLLRAGVSGLLENLSLYTLKAHYWVEIRKPNRNERFDIATPGHYDTGQSYYYRKMWDTVLKEDKNARLQYGGGKGKCCNDPGLTETDVHDCLFKAATDPNNPSPHPLKFHCLTFANRVLDKCCLRQGRLVDYQVWAPDFTDLGNITVPYFGVYGSEQNPPKITSQDIYDYQLGKWRRNFNRPR